MRKIILLLLLALFTLSSCGIQWKYTTLNHDPIYEDENYIIVSDDIKVDTLNEFQFRNKLRTDFSFRYDYAQYALSQPRSFDWNNRLLGTRYNWNSPYYGYNYWNRTQMWHDWVWGFSTPHRWSLFGYDRWGYNSWMGNAHWSYGWNSYYGWNNFGWNNYYGPNGYYNDWDWRYRMNNYAWQHRNRSNTVYVNGRRNTNINENRRSNTNRRANYNKPLRSNNNDQTIRNNTRTTRPTQSSSNGWRRGSREILPTQPIRVRQPNTVQPGQIRGGSRPSIPQQTRTSSSTSQQRRSSSIRRRN